MWVMLVYYNFKYAFFKAADYSFEPLFTNSVFNLIIIEKLKWLN